MKRGFSFVLATVLCLIMSTSIAFAGEYSSSYEVTFKKEPTKNHDELLERAKRGITDLDLENIKGINLKPVAKVENLNTGKKESAKVLTTTQLIESRTYDNGKVADKYATTVFAKFDPFAKNNNPQDSNSKLSYANTMLIASTNDNIPKLLAASRSDDAWDSSGGVKAYSTFYWDWVKVDGDLNNYYSIEGAEGGWVNHDVGRVELINKKVRLAQQGFSRDDGIVYQYTNPWHEPTNLTWSYNAPSSWKPVSSTSDYLVGVLSKTNITNGMSTWSLSLANTEKDGTIGVPW